MKKWCSYCKEEPAECEECGCCLYCCECEGGEEVENAGDFDADERGLDPEEDLHG